MKNSNTVKMHIEIKNPRNVSEYLSNSLLRISSLDFKPSYIPKDVAESIRLALEAQPYFETKIQERNEHEVVLTIVVKSEFRCFSDLSYKLIISSDDVSMFCDGIRLHNLNSDSSVKPLKFQGKELFLDIGRFKSDLINQLVNLAHKAFGVPLQEQSRSNEVLEKRI